MEEKEKVIFKAPAKYSIRDIAFRIEHKGYPETAEKFAEKLVVFGHSLSQLSGKYPLCKHQKFASRKLHCAVFHKNYIFVYKRVKDTLVIYNVIHLYIICFLIVRWNTPYSFSVGMPLGICLFHAKTLK